MKTTRGMRLHIGFFGKTNSGKSTLINKILGQDFSIVSDVKGTTTDVNQKAMELLPIGPVVLLDTAGIDDYGELGNLRIEKTKKALQRCDVAVFVTDERDLSEIEKEFLNSIPKEVFIVSVINKTDILENKKNKELLNSLSKAVIETNREDKNFIQKFKQALIEILPDDFINNGKILSDLINPKESLIFVIPIDKEAPKGRIILPQMIAIRETLDNNSIGIVCTQNELKNALDMLKTPPKLVVTDSQAFDEVSKIVPDKILMTSFSILFARLKGDLNSFIEGAKKIDYLKDNDRVLILESCSHHPIEDDIGRVKIPNLIKKYTKKNVIFEHFSGHDFSKEIEGYSLIIHCGACMTNRREVLNRIAKAKAADVPITNYGITIAKCLNILERALKPFSKIL